jgi:hypothetical protein
MSETELMCTHFLFSKQLLLLLWILETPQSDPEQALGAL